MGNSAKILIVCLVIAPAFVSAHDLSFHMYIGSQTFDVWQDYDPLFYDSLVIAQTAWEHQPALEFSELMLIKFYYIGLKP